MLLVEGYSVMNSNQITILLAKAQLGDKKVMDKIYQLLYAEIKAIAGFQLKQLKTGETITPTVLANECYLRINQNKAFKPGSRKHFLNCLAQSMRRFLIDNLRAQESAKRKGQYVDGGLTEMVGDHDVSFRLMDIDMMLEKMQEINVQLAETLEYKLLFSLTFPEIADVLQISERQVKRRWKQGKAMLLSLLGGESSGKP